MYKLVVGRHVTECVNYHLMRYAMIRAFERFESRMTAGVSQGDLLALLLFPWVIIFGVVPIGLALAVWAVLKFIVCGIMDLTEAVCLLVDFLFFRIPRMYLRRAHRRFNRLVDEAYRDD